MHVTESDFEIQLSDGAGMLIPATLNCVANDWNEGGFRHTVCRIILRFDESEIEASDRDFFEAFCRVREQLEKVGLHPLCYGAGRNVYPSGMCRDMSDGLKAYRMRMGRMAGMVDLVSIFDSGPDVDPASVKAQKEFFDRWLLIPKFLVPGVRAGAWLKERFNKWLEWLKR
jgi:hypothetical protein